VKVRIDGAICQGHGRCYDLAPQLFTEDEEGYGEVIGDGQVAPDLTGQAGLAADNCPEHAIEVIEEA
jgi:ferredoxin